MTDAVSNTLVSSRLVRCVRPGKKYRDLVPHMEESRSLDKNPGPSESHVLINPTLPWQLPRAYEYTDNTAGFDSSLIISAEIAFTTPLIDTYREWD
jgi:hypothetical protein